MEAGRSVGVCGWEVVGVGGSLVVVSGGVRGARGGDGSIQPSLLTICWLPLIWKYPGVERGPATHQREHHHQTIMRELGELSVQ